MKHLRWPIESKANFILSACLLLVVLALLLNAQAGPLEARPGPRPTPTAAPTPGAWLKPAQVPTAAPGATPTPIYDPPVKAAIGFGAAFAANLPRGQWFANVKRWSTPAWGAILATVDPVNVPNLFGVPEWEVVGRAEASQVIRLSWITRDIDVTVVEQGDGTYLVDNAEPAR